MMKTRKGGEGGARTPTDSKYMRHIFQEKSFGLLKERRKFGQPSIARKPWLKKVNLITLTPAQKERVKKLKIIRRQVNELRYRIIIFDFLIGEKKP